MKSSWTWTLLLVLLFAMPVTVQGQGRHQPLVPGSGTPLAGVGDDFEDPEWSWQPNLPKVMNHKDDALAKNLPLGTSANQRWYEGIKRGQPDIVRRVETPPNGLPGSQGALLLQSLHTGSSRPSHQQQQEDLIHNVVGVHGEISVSQAPSVVTRVWLPPIDEWENRTGCHFAFRISLETNNVPRQMGLFGKAPEFDGTYWPGMFINLNSKEGKGATGAEYDELYFWMKATDSGTVLQGPKITTTGWWTLGMSVTPDGRVHYFAKPGVEDLTVDDHIGSAYPFGYRAHRFRTFFYNVCNGDDGSTWSTRFIVDDPIVCVGGQEAAAGNASYRSR